MDQRGGLHGDKQRRRHGLIGLAALAHLPIVLLLAAILAAVLTVEGQTVQIGPRGGPYVRVPAVHAQLAVSAIAVPLIAVALWRLCTGTHLMLSAPRRPSVPLVLEPGECLVWQGKQGWRGIDRQRLGLALLASAGPVLYVIWLWRTWRGADALATQLFWTFMATFLLGGSVTLLFSPAAGRLMNDILGTMTITDRRVVWRTPKGHVYRELPGTEVIGAAVVEGDPARAWVTVTCKRDERVAEIDLFGVPRPGEAVRALEQMMARQAASHGRTDDG